MLSEYFHLTQYEVSQIQCNSKCFISIHWNLLFLFSRHRKKCTHSSWFWLLHTIHTDINLGSFLSNVKANVSSKVQCLVVHIYLSLLATEWYTRAHHNLLSLSLMSYFCTIFVHLYLVDKWKYVRTHHYLPTPQKLINFESLWLLHTVHTDMNWWLFLSCETWVSHI